VAESESAEASARNMAPTPLPDPRGPGDIPCRRHSRLRSLPTCSLDESHVNSQSVPFTCFWFLWHPYCSGASVGGLHTSRTRVMEGIFTQKGALN
jgi:hypothetical protein